MTAQEEYWQLSGKLAVAQSEFTDANHELDAFLAAHDGESFAVFRPEYIQAACKDGAMNGRQETPN